MNLSIDTPRWSLPLLKPCRYKGVKGGRGSGKSHERAESLIEQAILHPGLKVVCIREIQKSLKFSAKALIESKIQKFGLSRLFEITRDEIRTPGGGLIIFQGMQDHTADSIKSLEGFDIAWVEEGQSLSHHSFQLLRPTIRAPGSEIWVTWNPEQSTDAVDAFFNEAIANGSDEVCLVHVNYYDNPYLPDELLREMEYDRKYNPQSFGHVWLGEYNTKNEAQIFRGKYEEKAFTPRDDWDGPYFGLDFGFSQDPTAAVKCWIYDGCLYIEQDYGKIGLELDDTAPILRQHLPGIEKYVVRADSARPESISYLKRHGLPRIIGVQKGKGSVEDGIEFIKSFKRVFIHPDAAATLREFKLYSYKTDRLSGDVLPVVLDENNHCIAEGELIHTDCGLLPIEQVSTKHKVLTRFGFRQVKKAWQSGSYQPVLCIRTDSRALKCTGNHRIWTASEGFIRADELQCGHEILTNRIDEAWLRLLNLAARFTTDTQTAAAAPTGFISSVLSRVGRCGFIGKSGHPFTARYQMATTSTTKTVIPTTTASKTWNACQPDSIYLYTLLSFMPILTISAEYANIWPKLGRSLRHGMGAWKGWQNTVKSAQWPTKTSDHRKNRVSNADNHSRLKPSAAATCFALANARLHGAGQAGWMTWSAFVQYVGQFLNETNTPELLLARERVQTVTAARTANRVFDIEVCGQHEFFASGILVHNCIDAVRYALEPLMKNGSIVSRFKALS